MHGPLPNIKCQPECHARCKDIFSPIAGTSGWKVADGVTCLYSSRNQSKGHVASAVEHLFWVARPSTTCPCPSQHISAKGSCSIVGRAPPGLTAGAADPPRAVLPVVSYQLSTKGLGCENKNASRQYKRAVKRHGFALILGLTKEHILYIAYSPHLPGEGC